MVKDLKLCIAYGKNDWNSCSSCEYKTACEVTNFANCNNCRTNLANINSEANIYKFIQTFEGTETVFLQRNCYWFAHILKERFKGEIVYDEIDNHYLCMINSRIYDVRGDVTNAYENVELIRWDDMLFKDSSLYKRLVRDCVLKVY